MTEAVVPDTIEELLDEAVKDAKYHTVLEVWTEVLRSSEKVRKEQITPQWANRIVSAYSGVAFSDIGTFMNLFYDKVKDLADILEDVVSEDDEALKRISSDEDAKLNHHHYLTVIYSWQQRILLWELAWDWSSADAGAEMAAISEVHKMFFAEQGLTSLLDQIGFQFDDSDREGLVEMLEETRASFSEAE